MGLCKYVPGQIPEGIDQGNLIKNDKLYAFGFKEHLILRNLSKKKPVCFKFTKI